MGQELKGSQCENLGLGGRARGRKQWPLACWQSCSPQCNSWAVKAEGGAVCVMGAGSGSKYPAETHLSPFNPLK